MAINLRNSLLHIKGSIGNLKSAGSHPCYGLHHRLLKTGTSQVTPVAQEKQTPDPRRGAATAVRHDPYFEKIDLTFSNTRQCFRNKSTYELLRSIVVFKMCTFDMMVDNAKWMMKLARKVLGQRLFKMAMRASIYGQFVGGEGKHDIQGTISRNAAFGVKSILDYSAEEDMDEQKAKKLEVEATEVKIKEAKQGDFANHITKSHEKFGDRRATVVSARTHFYESEMACDKNMGIFMDSIDAVEGTTGGTGFAAIKITALGRPKLLLNISEVLVKSKSHYNKQAQVALNKIKDIDKSVGLEEWQTQLSGLGYSNSDIDMLFKKYDTNGDGELSAEERRIMLKDLDGRKEFEKLKRNLSSGAGVPVLRDGDLNRITFKSNEDEDLLSWKSLRDINRSLAPLFTVANPETGELEQIGTGLTREEERQMKRMIQRINTIIEHAEDRNVRVMVDAEQTYFQTAISRLAIEMQRLFNKDRALVFNTYQCYRRDTRDNVKEDIALSEKEGFHFACKFVRGAYMEQERSRAEAMGYDDPINPDYEATNAMYNGVVDMCMTKAVQQNPSRIAFMLASHNEDSVRLAVKRMNELGITPEDHIVNFGQLLGMCDQLSFSLGAAGYSVYKYVPYGPIEEVVPYLCRRAQENRAIMVGATKERKLLQKEFARRLKEGETFYKPVISV